MLPQKPKMTKLIQFLKTWMLPISITTGILLYLLYRVIGFLHPAGPFLAAAISKLQPTLLFFMLFLSFSKISPKQLRFRKWHIWLLIIQAGLFIGLALLMAALPEFQWKVVIEAAMLCLICPTATAAAVVTDRLGGEMAGLICYLVLINLVVAIIVPLFVPMIHPAAGMSFIAASALIIAKVFPTLICPALLAWAIQWISPELNAKIVSRKDAAFNIWAVSLCLAILMTTRAIFNSSTPFAVLCGIAIASLITCVFQFWAGRKNGKRYDDKVTTCQALGQKNTVFAIWMGYTFMDPVSSVAGGFYSIWHNVFNSWQMYRKQQEELIERGETGLGRD